ncbi:sensor domain-containing diguanylate cyclase [Turneriella parva]|uniref:diguanylate cyclase n=1 Tax=Turneriella parva (strain ATCC BAA-1111 / DSM 21527 / NCTC 11395 / H) TaxID=869212 RepID=I4B9E3_TURPD|nr:diguanylate cyclase [Turneriella parva]AFM13900.1 diguanylate cyclase [Turneriella parva DSM 21527]
MRIPDLLKRKLLLASVIFVAVMPILASALFITYRSFQQAKLDAVDRAKSLLSHIAEKQDELIAQTMQSMRILVLLPEVRNAGKDCPAFMSRFIASNPVYDNAGVVRPNGDIVCSGLAHKAKVNVAEREWFQLVVQTRSPQIGGLQFGKISGKPGIIAAMPIINSDGELASVLYLSVSVEWLEDVFAEYTLPEKSVITALDTKGVVLFQHPLKLDNEPSLMGKPYPNEKIWQHIKNAGESISPARVRESDKRYVYTFQRIESEDRAAMYISLRFLESAIYRDAYHNAITLILGLCLSLVATFLLAYVAGNYIFLRPVEQEIEKLNDVAETDPLTQILNRRGFERLAEIELAKASAGDHHSVLLMDIDHFKKINDEHGHAVGDEVLRETVQRIRGVLRESEIFGRIGGEEFAIFIPQVHRENAILLAERVRVAVDSLPFETATGKLKVTASVGVSYATNRSPLEKFLDRADKALYKSKRTGRNKVSI